MMRLLAQEYLSPVSSLGSPGVDELRWLRPVRPGDELALRTTVAGGPTCPAASRTAASCAPASNWSTLAGDVVLRLLAMNLVRARPAQR